MGWGGGFVLLYISIVKLGIIGMENEGRLLRYGSVTELPII